MTTIQHISKPGEIRINEGWLMNTWTVFTGMEGDVWKGVEFKDFENAQIFSAITKLNDTLRGKNE